jgi:hypothetical protein
VPTLQQIRDEINADPKTLGYATLWAQTNGPEAVAARMNELGAANPDETLFKAYVNTEEILAEMVWTEYTAWTAAVKSGIDQYLRGTRIKTGSAALRASLAAMIPAGTSKTNMIAAASRVCSRAEFLWGEGTQISDVQVADAMALP